MGGFLPLLTAGLGIAGDIFAARERTIKEGSTTRETVNPLTSPEFQGVAGATSQSIIQGLNQPVQFGGIQQGINQLELAGLQEVNSLSERIARQIENNNRARGLSFSGAAGFGEAVAGQARTGALSNLLAQLAQLKTQTALRIPQIRAGIQSDRIRGANQFLGVQPIGQDSTSVFEGTRTGPGNQLGAGFSSAADQLGFLRGQGFFDKNKNNRNSNINLFPNPNSGDAPS
ncbi:hypothetical protein LCGC14_1733610 [marine sediment metagenome]|uniref:Uncharacterized protein n=1 Tax=marine sediment metagenome TaxID=412755 RepID=A0A0F9HWH6_9ZZZZ